MAAWLYSLLSVAFVSLISLIGISTFLLKEKTLRKLMLYLVSFAAGGMFGSAFFHLLPESLGAGYRLSISAYIVSGIIASFVVEKFVQWRHCHIPTTKEHPHPFAFMNLVGDGLHNLIDGMIIAASYLANVQLGLTTTLAVVLHEIPQEIGDFGVLVHGGFTKKKALFYNFIFALTAVGGALVALTLGTTLTGMLLPFAAGGFIYIAGSDLIPELQKETKVKVSVLQFATFIAGLLVMFLLT